MRKGLRVTRSRDRPAPLADRPGAEQIGERDRRGPAISEGSRSISGLEPIWVVSLARRK